jgi:type VI secretion system protein ImpJ
MGDLRAAFNYVFDEPAILINFTSYKYNLYLASFPERLNFNYARLVLSVRADMPMEQLHNLFPTHAKLGPTEQIKDLVNLQIPGIPLSLLPVAPRQIPYHSGFIYFELDNRSEMWVALKESSALALHLSGHFPNVEMQLWAIKG